MPNDSANKRPLPKIPAIRISGRYCGLPRDPFHNFAQNLIWDTMSVAEYLLTDSGYRAFPEKSMAHIGPVNAGVVIAAFLCRGARQVMGSGESGVPFQGADGSRHGC